MLPAIMQYLSEILLTYLGSLNSNKLEKYLPNVRAKEETVTILLRILIFLFKLLFSVEKHLITKPRWFESTDETSGFQWFCFNIFTLYLAIKDCIIILSSQKFQFPTKGCSFSFPKQCVLTNFRAHTRTQWCFRIENKDLVHSKECCVDVSIGWCRDSCPSNPRMDAFQIGKTHHFTYSVYFEEWKILINYSNKCFSHNGSDPTQKIKRVSSVGLFTVTSPLQLMHKHPPKLDWQLKWQII